LHVAGTQGFVEIPDAGDDILEKKRLVHQSFLANIIYRFLLNINYGLDQIKIEGVRFQVSGVSKLAGRLGSWNA
jgi:hypothetical protein